MLEKVNLSNLYWLLISVLVVIFDQATKYFVTQELVLQKSWSGIPMLNLTLRHNTGSAFSFLQHASGWQNLLFSGIAVIVSIVLIISLLRLPKQEKWVAVAFALIIGGAMGNLWDRLNFGYVIDFIDFYVINWHFATFNIADSAITIGAIMLAIEMLFFPQRPSLSH